MRENSNLIKLSVSFQNIENLMFLFPCVGRLIPENEKRKIGLKTIEVVFIGYALDNIANKLLVINFEVSEICNSSVIEVRDGVCFEDTFPWADY